jgi:hypothetical protein
MIQRMSRDTIRAIRTSKSISLAKTIGGIHRIATTGTPHTIIEIGDLTYSICYFTERVVNQRHHDAGYRVFWPWPSNNQVQYARTYRSRSGIVAFIKRMKEEKNA